MPHSVGVFTKKFWKTPQSASVQTKFLKKIILKNASLSRRSITKRPNQQAFKSKFLKKKKNLSDKTPPEGGVLIIKRLTL